MADLSDFREIAWDFFDYGGRVRPLGDLLAAAMAAVRDPGTDRVVLTAPIGSSAGDSHPSQFPPRVLVGVSDQQLVVAALGAAYYLCDLDDPDSTTHYWASVMEGELYSVGQVDFDHYPAERWSGWASQAVDRLEELRERLGLE